MTRGPGHHPWPQRYGKTGGGDKRSDLDRHSAEGNDPLFNSEAIIQNLRVETEVSDPLPSRSR